MANWMKDVENKFWFNASSNGVFQAGRHYTPGVDLDTESIRKQNIGTDVAAGYHKYQNTNQITGDTRKIKRGCR